MVERSHLQLAPNSFNSMAQGTEGGISDEYSPDNSPEDEIAEPPYRALNPGLKRYGTISSLERVPSEDTDDNKTYSSEEESESDIKIVTKEVYDNNAQTFLNWTARAGNFIEESRAFIDRYLGRRDNSTEEAEGADSDWDKSRDKRTADQAASSGGDEEEAIEGETSATSGEEIWGTPTSGGENDDMQIFGSIEQTHSSPTKSSSSYTGDDDTELMMDELLMAPPMTASAVRGLLPRRKLEPLFEEDSETGDSDDDSKPLSGRDNQVGYGQANAPIGLSPRLEMRLALNHDILGDEDLLTYSPGPDLTAILGRDLSTYHRMSGKDIIMNRIVTRVSSYMNIQTVATLTTTTAPSGAESPDEKTLSDLERLARREKVYCMTQLNHNASQLKRVASFNSTQKHTSKLFNFLHRRNSENHLSGFFTSKDSTDESHSTCHSDSSRLNSPRKETAKPLDRRFWKQLSKRRRGSFCEELATGAS
uniref:Uncharacterized protein n=1 Tax=Anopheles dirus TaxID=7168 RepID=A0A182NN74_9DIPT